MRRMSRLSLFDLAVKRKHDRRVVGSMRASDNVHKGRQGSSARRPSRGARGQAAAACNDSEKQSDRLSRSKKMRGLHAVADSKDSVEHQEPQLSG